MRLLICAGGTGGGVYPALTVMMALKNEAPQDASQQVLWVGREGGMETALVERAGVPFKALPAAGVHGVGLLKLPGNILKLLRGVVSARQIVHQFQPDVLLLTGGYVAAPMVVAVGNVPTVLYVPDIEPAMALKFLARFANRIAVTTEDSLAYFPKHSLRRNAQVIVTGYPTRPELEKWNKENACKTLGLQPNPPVLLFLGGSKGARSINQALSHILPSLLTRFQVVHVSGELDWDDAKNLLKTLDPGVADRYHPFAYLHDEMGAALASANLVISRSGGSSLGEYPLFGLPAILVPYPHAWRYQKVNADYLARYGAAVILPDNELDNGLLPLIEELFNHPDRLEAMGRNMKVLHHPQASEHIAAIVRDIASKRTQERKVQ